ncbi:MAG: hypothetical protein LUH54_00625 [Firmicutes bacterium]|nr:hypothetical protein [Bacillota bacterium]
MCDICGCDIGHVIGCPMQPRSRDSAVCMRCFDEIESGDLCIYVSDFCGTDESGYICSHCIEELSPTEVLSVCELSSLSELIGAVSDKIIYLDEKR